jgi:pyruvate kinase
VRRPEDVQELKQILAELGAPQIPVISKIETQEAIDNLEAIIVASDGAMVARGDLAVEIPAEEVPRRQKEIIALCNIHCKPVITATQMLESMITSPVPTRAEVSDVANAVYDGTDAVMLSEESTLGAYPLEAVRTLARIALASEQTETTATEGTPETIARAVAEAAELLNPVAIVALTEHGVTARNVASFQPICPIVALTPSEHTQRELALSRGVHPYLVPAFNSLDETLAFVSVFLQEKGYGKAGDTVIVTAGLNFGQTGATNMLVVVTL